MKTFLKFSSLTLSTSIFLATASTSFAGDSCSTCTYLSTISSNSTTIADDAAYLSTIAGYDSSTATYTEDSYETLVKILALLSLALFGKSPNADTSMSSFVPYGEVFDNAWEQQVDLSNNMDMLFKGDGDGATRSDNYYTIFENAYLGLDNSASSLPDDMTSITSTLLVSPDQNTPYDDDQAQAAQRFISILTGSMSNLDDPSSTSVFSTPSSSSEQTDMMKYAAGFYQASAINSIVNYAFTSIYRDNLPQDVATDDGDQILTVNSIVYSLIHDDLTSQDWWDNFAVESSSAAIKDGVTFLGGCLLELDRIYHALVNIEMLQASTTSVLLNNTVTSLEMQSSNLQSESDDD